jgi:hypothetical protein
VKPGDRVTFGVGHRVWVLEALWTTLGTAVLLREGPPFERRSVRLEWLRPAGPEEERPDQDLTKVLAGDWMRALLQRKKGSLVGFGRQCGVPAPVLRRALAGVTLRRWHWQKIARVLNIAER